MSTSGGQPTGGGTPGVPAGGVASYQDAVATTGQVAITGNLTPAVGPLAVSGLDVFTVYYTGTGYTGGAITYTPQVSYDGGVTWMPVILQEMDTVTTSRNPLLTPPAQTAGSIVHVGRCTGATHIRVNTSGWSAGGTNPTITVTASPGSSAPWQQVVMLTAAGGSIDAANQNPATGSNRLAVATGVGATQSLNAVTATGAGTSVDLGVTICNPVMEVLAASVTSGFTIRLEGSLEGTNWYPIASATVAANGTTVVTASTAVAGDIIPARFLRANVTARTDGTISAWVAGA
jgi:hypothetical protein